MLKKFLTVTKDGCVLFTVITIISYITGTLLSFENKAFIPTLKWIILFFVFSVFLAFANMILKSKKYSLGLRLGLHALSCAFLYFVVVVLCGGFISSGAQTMIAFMFFILIYGLFAVTYAIVSSAKNKKTNKKQNYQSMFK